MAAHGIGRTQQHFFPRTREVERPAQGRLDPPDPRPESLAVPVDVPDAALDEPDVRVLDDLAFVVVGLVLPAFGVVALGGAVELLVAFAVESFRPL